MTFLFQANFCGIQLDSSSFQEVSHSSLCYLDQQSYSKDACNTFGGDWDAIEAMQNPSSPYTCSANRLFNGSQNCWKGCSNMSWVDPYSQITYTFHGECEAYHMCSINVDKTTCLSISSSSPTVSWMKFDWTYYALSTTADNDGYCVIFYANKWSGWSDSGGNLSITDTATCQSTAITYNSKLYFGQAKPARSFRDGFLNSSNACNAGLCPSQLWVCQNYFTFLHAYSNLFWLIFRIPLRLVRAIRAVAPFPVVDAVP